MNEKERRVKETIQATLATCASEPFGQGTRKLLEKDPLWESLRKRLVEPTSVSVGKTRAHKQKITERHSN